MSNFFALIALIIIIACLNVHYYSFASVDLGNVKDLTKSPVTTLLSLKSEEAIKPLSPPLSTASSSSLSPLSSKQEKLKKEKEKEEQRYSVVTDQSEEGRKAYMKDLAKPGLKKPVEVNAEGQSYDFLTNEALIFEKNSAVGQVLDENSKLKKILNLSVRLAEKGGQLEKSIKVDRINTINKTIGSINQQLKEGREKGSPLPSKTEKVKEESSIAKKDKGDECSSLPSSTEQQLLCKREKLVNLKKELLKPFIERNRLYYSAFMALYEYQIFTYSPKPVAQFTFEKEAKAAFDKIIKILKKHEIYGKTTIMLTRKADKLSMGDTPVLLFPGVDDTPIIRDIIAIYEIVRDELITPSKTLIGFKLEGPDYFKTYTDYIRQFVGVDLRPQCLQLLDLVEILARKGIFHVELTETQEKDMMASGKGDNVSVPRVVHLNDWIDIFHGRHYSESDQIFSYEPYIIETKRYVDLLAIEKKHLEKIQSEKEQIIGDYAKLVKVIEENLAFTEKLEKGNIEKAREKYEAIKKIVDKAQKDSDQANMKAKSTKEELEKLLSIKKTQMAKMEKIEKGEGNKEIEEKIKKAKENIEKTTKEAIEAMKTKEKIIKENEQRFSLDINKNRTIKLFAILLRAQQGLDSAKDGEAPSFRGIGARSPPPAWHKYNNSVEVIKALENQLKYLVKIKDWPQLIRLSALLPAIVGKQRAGELRTEYHHQVLETLKKRYRSKIRDEYSTQNLSFDIDGTYFDSFIIPVYNRIYPKDGGKLLDDATSSTHASPPSPSHV